MALEAHAAAVHRYFAHMKSDGVQQTARVDGWRKDSNHLWSLALDLYVNVLRLQSRYRETFGEEPPTTRQAHCRLLAPDQLWLQVRTGGPLDEWASWQNRRRWGFHITRASHHSVPSARPVAPPSTVTRDWGDHARSMLGDPAIAHDRSLSLLRAGVERRHRFDRQRVSSVLAARDQCRHAARAAHEAARLAHEAVARAATFFAATYGRGRGPDPGGPDSGSSAGPRDGAGSGGGGYSSVTSAPPTDLVASRDASSVSDCPSGLAAALTEGRHRPVGQRRQLVE